MRKVELTLCCGFYPINEVRNFMANICRQLGLKRTEIYKIKAAVDEALTNIIKHSYRNMKGSINIRLDSDGTKITIYMQDSGRAFKIKKAKRRTPNDIIKVQKEGGLGLSMIEHLMDEVRYVRKQKYNQLIMVKYHGSKHRT
ncbi:MAG: ATP-binding protein [bacterium]